jgi:hypothetical protein
MIEPYDRFWAEFLGVEPSDWTVPGASVNAHVGLTGYCGVWFFRRRDRLVVSAPDGWVPHLRLRLAHASPADTATEEAALRELFGDDFIRRIRPVFAVCTARCRPTEGRRTVQSAASAAGRCITFVKGTWAGRQSDGTR